VCGHYSVFIDQFDRIITGEPDVRRHVQPAYPDAAAGHSGTKLVIGSAIQKICRYILSVVSPGNTPRRPFGIIGEESRDLPKNLVVGWDNVHSL